MKWVLILLVVGAAVYIYRKKQDQIFDGHRLNKDLKKWKDYKHKMRVLAKEKEGIYSPPVDPYQEQNYLNEDNKNFCHLNKQEIDEIISVNKKIAVTDEDEYLNESPRKVVRKKRWRWKGWRRR